MSAAVKQFHEEEAIGKTYDLQVARRLLRYLRPYTRLLIPALVLTLLLNLLGILQPKFTQYAIDWYILPRKTQGIALFAMVYLGAQFGRFVFSYFQVVLLNTIGQYVMFDLRREIYDKLQHQEIAYFDRNPVGRIMTRLTADVDALNELFTSGVTDLLGDLVMIAGIIAVMVWMDWRLTLVTLLTVPLLFAATTWFRKGARRGYDLVRTRLARIYAFLQEHFSGAQTVQIFNAEAKSIARFADINDQHRKANIETIFYYAVFFPLVDFIGAVGIALIIWYGGYRVMNHALSLGALVGHTGSGKTTITNLLMRFYDVQKGRILLDGVDVRDWELQSLRENFAVVLQDIFLFTGTVESNIRLGRGDISDERIQWAATEVRADNFIRRLPHDYKSEVRERGAGLSVGQKQLISFARALAFDPALLILDEATSSIDTETEQFIQLAIDRVMRNRTSLVVAHRLSTIQRADKIIVLHHGEIREQGTHQDLLALQGLYWRLYKLQYSDPARPAPVKDEEEEEITYKPRGPSFGFSEGMG